MIGYAITEEALGELVEAQAPGWLKKAAERTATFKKDGKYSEKKGIWSAVKPVYMRLQGGSKCAYCERKLESENYGKGEQDVEHFRPKKKVRPWKLPKSLEKLGVTLTPPDHAAGGYHLLAYHLLNYCAACKPCNSALKSDCFPIAGKYQTKGTDPAKLSTEKPLLIYPVGGFDDDPEELIRFHGISPQAVAKSGHKRYRALVTIEFFKLDDEAKRKNLMRERAFIIVSLFPQLKKASGSGLGVAEARDFIRLCTDSTAPHANCARSFLHLFQTDQLEAEAVASKANQFLNSIS
jgi:hypothetical protein